VSAVTRSAPTRADGEPSSINYHREGTGPPLVLLHGAGHHALAWRPVVALLRDEFDTFACQSPGFGLSPPLPVGVKRTIAGYADAFEELFSQLGLERPHVAGNSMGGTIGLELARRNAISSLCAICPAGFWNERERLFAGASLMLIARTPRALRPAIRAIARTRAGRAVLFWQLYGYPQRLPEEAGLAALRDAFEAPSFVDVLHAFAEYRLPPSEELRDVPITVAWGIHDHLLPYRLQAPRARALMPFARHLALGAGHLPHYDDPAAVAAAIRISALDAT
jgi:pimeloyl-ACP methyl ester carboxylesterase